MLYMSIGADPIAEKILPISIGDDPFLIGNETARVLREDPEFVNVCYVENFEITHPEFPQKFYEWLKSMGIPKSERLGIMSSFKEMLKLFVSELKVKESGGFMMLTTLLKTGVIVNKLSLTNSRTIN